MDLVRGFGEGLQAVFSTKQKGALHPAHRLHLGRLPRPCSRSGFYCLPTMVDVPFAGILAGFIAGAVGIILVQGGIGVYPAFVALIVGVYMAAPEGGGLLRPDALAMGWLLWVAQTLMIIVLGGAVATFDRLANEPRRMTPDVAQAPANPRIMDRIALVRMVNIWRLKSDRIVFTNGVLRHPAPRPCGVPARKPRRWVIV